MPSPPMETETFISAILQATQISPGRHRWVDTGGSVEVSRERLQEVLHEAYLYITGWTSRVSFLLTLD